MGKIEEAVKKMINAIRNVFASLFYEDEENQDSNFEERMVVEISNDIKITIEGNNTDKVLYYYHLFVNNYKHLN